MTRRATIVSTALAGALSLPAAASVALEIQYQDESPVLTCTAASGTVLALERSTGFDVWTEVARVFDQFTGYRDAARVHEPSGFYRILSWQAQAGDDWSNVLSLANQRLFRPGSGSGLSAIAIVKWSLLLEHADRVYFQDTVRYPFHLNFARARLPGYADISALAYGQQCLYPGPSQRMVVGSVMRAPAPWIREIGIEITGSAAFPAAQVMDWLETVQPRLQLGSGWKVFYMPSDEQRAETEAHRSEFEARGITIDSPNRWANAVHP